MAPKSRAPNTKITEVCLIRIVMNSSIETPTTINVIMLIKKERKITQSFIFIF